MNFGSEAAGMISNIMQQIESSQESLTLSRAKWEMDGVEKEKKILKQYCKENLIHSCY